ncbi:hypothetical protein OIN60_10750 [Paenibacillus sp. P96]|uniref:Transposase IS4-like domain-containing protein n=1 Tax=Paenibacillus zeirhizosphaerae TaxID=2987519 RepID=A0ABT9FR86_9BACL|nr:hypothetical protein [Paenibacillus sp. P96]MDP4097249.1 hypothetical protein [Paenibacillus sp. P96]
MTDRAYTSLWMTQFLRGTDQEKRQRIQEAKRNNDIDLISSIYFHLSLRNQEHLL